MTAAGVVEDLLSGTAPFPGLRSFRTSESHLFFGRDEQVDALLDRLAERRLLAVVGTSGSGKSSLVHAGLIPELRRGNLGPSGSSWIVAVLLRPGVGPLDGLAQALATAFRMPASEVPAIRRRLDESSAGLTGMAREHLRPGERLMIVVDQFEELFRYSRDAGDRVESTAFVKMLLAATGASDVTPLAADLPVYAVLTMRSDYLGKCAVFRGLPEALNDAQYLVPRLGRDQQREAIEGPIAIAGAQIASRLVERLLNEAGDDQDQLPVLQHALLRLWEHSAEEVAQGIPLDLAQYEAVGGVTDALNRDGDDTLERLGTETRKTIARRVFQRLVEPRTEDEETRFPARFSELKKICQADESELWEAIRAFRERGFLTVSSEGDGGDPLIDISHESLIRQWEKLSDWVRREGRSAAIYRRLAESALRGGTVYAGPDLARALEWIREESPNEDWAARYDKRPDAWVASTKFLGRSRRRQALRKAAYALGLAFAVGMAVVFFALYRNAEHQKQVADRQKQIADEKSQEAGEATRRADEQTLIATAAAQTAEGQTRIADRQREVADRQKKVAESRRLAVTALLSRQNPLDLALLLDREIMRGDDTFAARSILLSALQANPGFLTSLPHPDGAESVAFSPDGKILASAGWDHTVRLWDTATGQTLGILRGHTETVNSVAFSPDGRTLASAGDGTVRLWDVITRQALGAPLLARTNDGAGTSLRVNSVTFSPDGKTLASASDDGAVRLWDVASRRPRPEDEPPQDRGNIWGVTFSPDGRTLAWADIDTVRLWDLASREPRGQVAGHAVAFSPDGKTLAAAGNDQAVRLWDVATQRLLPGPLTGHKEWIQSLAFSPDGRTLASTDRDPHDHTVRLWDVAGRKLRGDPLSGHTGIVESVAFGPDGKMLASSSQDGTVRLWDATALFNGFPILGRPVSGSPSPLTSVAFSPDGKTLASADSAHSVQFWDVVNRQARGEPLHGHADIVTSVAFSPDGKTLASAGKDSTIRLWSVPTGRPLGELLGRARAVFCVVFSPDGRTLASAGKDGTVRFWDVATRHPLGEPLKGHTRSVFSVAFSPDGKTLASASDDTTVRLWDLATRQPRGEPLEGNSSALAVAFSPDGKILASANGQVVRLWDVTSRRPVGEPLTGHTSPVTSLAFSPDGKVLASAAQDSTVRLWDVATRQELGDPLWGHTGTVMSVAFSPDGKTLASAGFGPTARLWLWNVDPASWANQACSMANRNLSMREWRFYMGLDTDYHRTCPDLPPGEGAPAK